MNKNEFIEAVKNDPSLLDNYKEVEIDDGARGHHTAIQFKDCDEPFESGELIDYFDGMPIVEQMYLAALVMANQQNDEIWKNPPIGQCTRHSLSYLELNGFDNPSCKLSYASHIDTPPHKTGTQMEWLDELE